MTRSIRRSTVAVVLLVLLVLVLWRCTAGSDGDEEPALVSVFGPWLGEEAVAFAAVLDDFTDATGIEVAYVGSSDFDSDLRSRVTDGLGLPDFAIVPQPALIAELVAMGVVEPLADETVDALVQNFPFSRDELVVFDGEAYLEPYRNNLKSLVWYRPEVFAERGWEVPTTLDDLHALVEEIAITDVAPWCFTMEAGSVTGWTATDWVEDLVLRRGGTAAYDEWLSGERPFDDELIREAYEEFEELVLAPGRVAGGIQRVVSTDVAEASGPLFTDPPGCAMYKQGSFAVNWFPDHTEVGSDGDVDAFVLPGVDADASPPLLVGGDGAVRFNDRDEVAELMTFLATPEGTRAWVDRGGFLSRRTTVDLDEYDEVDTRFATLLLDATDVRFDASDTLVSSVREVLLTESARFVAEANYLDPTAGLDTLVAAVDRAREEVFGAGDGDSQTVEDG